MRNNIVRLLLFAFQGIMLGVMGYHIQDWQYWAITLSTIAIAALSVVKGVNTQ